MSISICVITIIAFFSVTYKLEVNLRTSSKKINDLN